MQIKAAENMLVEHSLNKAKQIKTLDKRKFERGGKWEDIQRIPINFLNDRRRISVKQNKKTPTYFDFTKKNKIYFIFLSRKYFTMNL